MTTKPIRDIDEAAHLWVIRLHDSAFDDWDGFTGWLESDPDHPPAYEAALDADRWAGELYRHRPRAEFLPFARPEAASRPRRRWYAAGGAIAAALVAALTFTLSGNRPHEIATAPGEHRTVPLADGSRVILNGGTRVLIDPENPRTIALASGEALFEVRHDAANPFVVTVGETRLLDAGTVFNVVSDGTTLDVAVAEGAVIYEPGKGEIKLAAGDALSRAGGGARPMLRKANPQAIGGWQDGKLEYGNATLGQVARDLGRNLGTAIRPAGGADQLRFTGTLAIGGRPDDVLDRAGPLLGVEFAQDGGAWRMTPADGAPPN